MQQHTAVLVLLLWKRPRCRAAGEGEGMRQGRRSFTGTLEEAVPLCRLCTLALFEMANSISESTESQGSSCPRCASVGVPWHVQGWGWAAFPQPGCRNCSSPAPFQSHPAAQPAAGIFQNVSHGVARVQVCKRVRWLCMALVSLARNLSPAFGIMPRGVGLCVKGAKLSP